MSRLCFSFWSANADAHHAKTAAAKIAPKNTMMYALSGGGSVHGKCGASGVHTPEAIKYIAAQPAAQPATAVKARCLRFSRANSEIRATIPAIGRIKKRPRIIKILGPSGTNIVCRLTLALSGRRSRPMEQRVKATSSHVKATHLVLGRPKSSSLLSPVFRTTCHAATQGGWNRKRDSGGFARFRPKDGR